MFDVTVSDAGSRFHITAGLLNLLSFGLIGSSGHKEGLRPSSSGTNAPSSPMAWTAVDFRFLPDGGSSSPKGRDVKGGRGQRRPTTAVDHLVRSTRWAERG